MCGTHRTRMSWSSRGSCTISPFFRLTVTLARTHGKYSIRFVNDNSSLVRAEWYLRPKQCFRLAIVLWSFCFSNGDVIVSDFLIVNGNSKMQARVSMPFYCSAWLNSLKDLVMRIYSSSRRLPVESADDCYRIMGDRQSTYYVLPASQTREFQSAKPKLKPISESTTAKTSFSNRTFIACSRPAR